jgi:hypothetical protein
MNRRDLLKILGAATASLALRPYITGPIEVAAAPWIPADIQFDMYRKLVIVNKHMTLTALYRQTQDTFDLPAMMEYSLPMSRQSDYVWEMQNGWRVEERSIQFLTGGLLCQGEDIWMYAVPYATPSP